MKRYFIIPMLLTVLASACSKKDDVSKESAATLNVINAVVDGGTVKVNPGATSAFSYSKSNLNVAYGANYLYQVVPGNRNISVVNVSDTNNTYFSRAINFTQTINTLYLSGKAPVIDTTFREEKDVPFIQSYGLNPDSSSYIRFVNLSANSTPLNIKLGTSTEVSGLAYKSVTGFKKYSVNFKVTGSYNFEVWSTDNTTKLATITTLSPANIRFRTLSVIIRGIMPTLADPSPSSALALFQVYYY